MRARHDKQWTRGGVMRIGVGGEMSYCLGVRSPHQPMRKQIGKWNPNYNRSTSDL